MHGQGFLEHQTIIPELLGTMPRAHEPEEELDECEAGEYFKEFYNDDYGQEPNVLATTLLMMCNPAYMKYTERMGDAINDAMTYIRELEEKLARSGNAYLLQDASNGAKSHAELIKEKELYKAKWEASEVKCQLMTDLYEQTKEMLLTTTRDKVGADTKVSELNAEKYNKKSFVASQTIKSAAESGADQSESEELGADLEELPRVANGHQFASADGIPGKAKQKMVVIMVSIFGYGLEEISDRLGIQAGTIKDYFIKGRKALVGSNGGNVATIYKTSEGDATLLWKGRGMDDDTVPYKDHLTTDERRLVDDFLTNHSYMQIPSFIAA